MTTRFPLDAILLAAGLGTRLRPLTLSRPKPLVPVAGVPLIERVIAGFAAEGVTRFAVNAHYLADQMETAVAALPTHFPGADFFVSRENGNLLDTGGGAKKALSLVESDPVLVANTDAFWQAGKDVPLRHMTARHDEKPDGIVLLCADPARALGFRRSHDFYLDPSGTITPDRGRPVIYAGVALLQRTWFSGTPEGPFSLNRIFEKALAGNRLYGVLLETDWYHIGDPDALAEAESLIGKG